MTFVHKSTGPRRRTTVGAGVAAVVVAGLLPGLMPAATGQEPPALLGTLAGGEGDGPGTAVAQAPSDLALDRSRVLVADGLYGVVRALDTTSGVQDVVAALPAPAAAAGVNGYYAPTVNPMGVAPDGSGGVLVTETKRHRVWSFAADGTARLLAGGSDAGFRGDGGPATQASLSSPTGVAAGRDGSVYIADSGNHVVRRISPDGIISTVAGTGAAAGFAGDGASAIRARLSQPQDVAVDASGRLLIADSGNKRIRRVDTTGAITTVAGTSVQPSGPDLRCPATGSVASSWIDSPTSVTTDTAGGLVVTAGACVVRVSAGRLTTLAGTGDSGGDTSLTLPALQSNLDTPAGVAVTADGAVYVGVGPLGQVRRIAGGTMTTVAGVTRRVGGYHRGRFDSGDQRPASSSQLPDVVSLTTAPDGRLTFSDGVNGVIRSVDPDSTLAPLTSLAGGEPSASPSGGQLLSASSFTRTAVAYDVQSRLLVADTDQDRLYRVGADGRLQLLAGGGTACRLPLEGDGGPAALAALADPVAVATDAAGTTYVAERFAGRIRKIAPDGTITSVLGAYSLACTGPTYPRSPIQGTIDALAVGADGTLWATTAGCLYEIRPDGVVRCADDLLGGPGRPAGGVAALADGSVVYSDPMRHQVRRITADGTVSVAAGTGRAGCGADGQPATAAPLGLPGPLTIAQDGTLVVYDAACHTLRTIGANPNRSLTRLSGPDRLITGVEIARDAYPPGTARAAVLARSDSFADALAGAPLAAHVDGPLLLTARTGLSAWTESQLRAALPAGATVHVLGGAGALSPAVDARLRTLGFAVVRYAGADRYATAAAISRDGIGSPTATFVTTGLSFPDALSASAAAASTGGAVLLTAGASMPAATADQLAAHPTKPTYAVGGPATLAVPDAIALAGTDRYATSAAVAARLFPAPPAVALATGTAFADALTGAAAAATKGAPLLLTPPTSLSAPALSYLTDQATRAMPVLIYGGRAAVSDTVASQTRQLLSAK